jgi:hypothetical protein
MGVFSAVDEVGIHILVPFNQKNPTEEQKLAQQATLLNQVTVIRLRVVIAVTSICVLRQQRANGKILFYI